MWAGLHGISGECLTTNPFGVAISLGYLNKRTWLFSRSNLATKHTMTWEYPIQHTSIIRMTVRCLNGKIGWGERDSITCSPLQGLIDLKRGILFRERWWINVKIQGINASCWTVHLIRRTTARRLMRCRCFKTLTSAYSLQGIHSLGDRLLIRFWHGFILEEISKWAMHVYTSHIHMHSKRKQNIP